MDLIFTVAWPFLLAGIGGVLCLLWASLLGRLDQ